MKPYRHLFLIALAAMFLVACGASAEAPTATPIPPTPTPVPPTATPIPPTATPEPPTPTPTTNAIQAAMTAQAATQVVKPAETTAPPGSERLEIGEITSVALAGNLLGDPATREYIVLLPPNYHETDRRYPVVYVLHGFGSDEWALVYEIQTTARNLSYSPAKDIIYVFPDASNALGGSFYRSSITIGDYEFFITEELVNHIDATYRTLARRNSRGVMGCSMGGEGAVHLGLSYPDIFAAAAGISGFYDGETEPSWETARRLFKPPPADLDDFANLAFEVRVILALAASATANPDNPPYYFDMPFTIQGGERLIVPDVAQKLNEGDSLHDAQDYIEQPIRLNGLMIYHGINDEVDLARDFDRKLTELGIEHEYLEAPRGHCDLDYEPVLEFMAAHLEF